ncbi:hypothetical protein ABW20_dc0101437 [Dactylellina cionopaga]|nr:hypothetical protein ABW20_dc0101437 [Dactylellina cionopaga]
MAQARRQKVAICGSGGLGRYIAEAIIGTGEWDLVILSRYAQPELSERGIKVRVVDYSSPESLHDTLARQRVHTVISVIPDPYAQLTIIDACVSAGVTRFVPAEFEGSPSQRPLYTSGDRDRMTVLRRLDELREAGHLMSTSFTCGLFMEYFAPGGWRGCGGGGWNDGTFLIDLKHKKATLPVDSRAGPNAYLCLTSAEDVAQFVCGALSLDYWPPEMRMFGERLRLRDLLAIAEGVRDREFKVKLLSEDDIEYNMNRAVTAGDWKTQSELQTMRSISDQEYDIVQRDLNALFPEIRPVSFERFLRRYWRASTH